MVVWISSAKYGSITISGKKYKHDVIVTWEGKVKSAQAEGYHLFDQKELVQLLLERPEIVVIGIGIGKSTLMKISPEVVKFADEKKLKIVEKPTALAIKEFNELVREGKKVVAYMHVTS